MKFASSLMFVMLAATAALSQTATPAAAPPAADSRMHKPISISSSSKSPGSAHATESVAAAPAADAAKRKNGAVIAADYQKTAQSKSSLDGASKDAAKSVTAPQTKPRDVASGQATGKRETVSGQATGVVSTPHETGSGMASGK